MAIKCGQTKRLTGTTVIAIGIGVKVVGLGNPAIAHASMTQKEFTEAVKSYQIPQGSMDIALNRLADESGVRMIYRSYLTAKLRTSGLAGNYTLAGALDALLFGTGLHYRLNENGETVSVVLAQAGNTTNDASPRGARSLPTIDVAAARPRPVRSASQRGGGGGRSGAGASNGPATGKEALGGRLTGYMADTASTTLKTDMPLMKTPFSVQVITRETMDDQQAIDLNNAVVGNSSGVLVVPNSSFYTGLMIRGFSTNTSVYFNGLRQYQLMNVDTANLQSVDVLKGPAAMLYGRSEPGGLVDLVPKRPLDTPYYSVQEQAGSYGFTRTTVDATAPLNKEKTLAYRFNGSYVRSDSFQDFANKEYYFLAPTFSIRPNDQFRANIDLQFMHDVFMPESNTVAVGNRPASIPITRYLQDPSYTGKLPQRFDLRYYGYDWTFDIDKNWSLTNRLYYRSQGQDLSSVSIIGLNQATGVLTRGSYYQSITNQGMATNLDLKGKFVTGPLSHSTLVGFDYYSNYQPLAPFYLVVPASKYLPTFNIYAPIYGSNFAGVTPNLFTTNAESWKGVYAQDTISFWDDKIHLLLGGRYDWAEVDWQVKNNNLRTAWIVSPNWSKAFSPRVGLTIQPMPWLSFYANYTKSLNADNGLNAGSAIPTPLPPVRSYEWEGGIKAEFLDKRLLLTLAYFDLVKTNVPGPDPTNPGNTLVAGEAESKGFEVDLKGRIDENWSVIANYTHDDVRVTKGSLYNPLTEINTQLFIAGNRLPTVPKNMGNLWVKYDADGLLKGLSIGGGAQVVGSAFGDNANSFTIPAYAILNGMLAYRFDVGPAHLTAQLNAKNLLDTTYYASSASRFQIMPGTPRTIIGSLRLEF